MESPQYAPTITLGNILTILSMIGTIVYSFATMSIKLESHTELTRKEHEQFVQREAMDIWKSYISSDIAEIKQDIKEIKRAVR